jgi:very-short-patch-repair endonuclease
MRVAFTRAEALRVGVTPAQLRGSAVRTVFRGVYTVRDDPGSLLVRAHAALKLAGPDALLCETTGLALLDVALPDAALEETVHVWVPPGVAGPRMAGIRVHHCRLEAPPKQVEGRVWSADPRECWLQAAERLGIYDLVVLADGMMRFDRPLVFIDDLRDAVAGTQRRYGRQAAAAALALARDGTDSPMESVVRMILVEAGLPSPEVNYPIRDDTGHVAYRLDMAYPAQLVAVEYDGAVHVQDTRQMRRDRARLRHLQDLGWRVITATASDVRDPAGLIASVRKALAGRTPTH